jgi:hypothetical protein
VPSGQRDPDIIKKNTETLIDAGKVVHLEVNAEKAKYMLLSHHHNAGQNHHIRKLTDLFKMRQSSNIS